MKLENINTDQTFYGVEAEKHNRNYSIIARSFSAMENRQLHDKGWYPSEVELSRKQSTAINGDFAIVKDTVYFWNYTKWEASSFKIDNIQALSKVPYLIYPDPISLPIYFKGDSIYLTIGNEHCFSHANRILFNVFIHSSRTVSATFPFTEGLEIRKDVVSKRLYTVIPREMTSGMELGDYRFEMASWYPTGIEGEEAVKRDRGYIFSLQEFETIK